MGAISVDKLVHGVRFSAVDSKSMELTNGQMSRLETLLIEGKSILIMYWVYEVTQYRHGDQQGLLSDLITALLILLIQH